MVGLWVGVVCVLGRLLVGRWVGRSVCVSVEVFVPGIMPGNIELTSDRSGPATELGKAEKIGSRIFVVVAPAEFVALWSATTTPEMTEFTSDRSGPATELGRAENSASRAFVAEGLAASVELWSPTRPGKYELTSDWSGPATSLGRAENSTSRALVGVAATETEVVRAPPAEDAVPDASAEATPLYTRLYRLSTMPRASCVFVDASALAVMLADAILLRS